MGSATKEIYDDKWNMEIQDAGKTVSAPRKWISLAVLFFVNLLNYMDRYTVSAVLNDFSGEMCRSDPPPADGKEERCSTSQEGLIQTAFVVIYMLAAPIFGYLGDRYSRKIIMALGIIVWGALSLAASFMPSYWTFLIFRALIAVGESAFTTIAPTVLGDLFTDETRSIVYGVFYIAIPLGSGLGFVVGGAPSEWRYGLRITPGFTFLSAVLVFFLLYDPPRGESEGKKQEAVQPSSYKEDLKYIGGVKSFVLNAAGFTCVTFTTGALAWFAPVYFIHGINSHNATRGCGTDFSYVSPVKEDDVAFYVGLITCAGGLLGVVAGMLLSKYLRPRFEWIDPFICGVSLLTSIPLLVAGVLLARDNLVLTYGIVFLGMFFLNFNWSVAVDMTIYVITPSRRATAEAIHLMFTHALGEAGAPYLVGLLADGLEVPVKESNPEYCQDLVDYYGIQYAMFLPFTLLGIGGILFLVACRWVVKDKQAVERESREV